MVVSFLFFMLLLPFCPGLSVDADAADAAGDESEEDVGGGDKPEGEDVDGGVAVVRVARQSGVHHRLVDAVNPHAPCSGKSRSHFLS